MVTEIKILIIFVYVISVLSYFISITDTYNYLLN